MKTSELSGAALDWAVAKCEGWEKDMLRRYVRNDPEEFHYEYSTDWAQGGPIIEREKIDVCIGCDTGNWYSMMNNTEDALEDLVFMQGETPLIAAMRCYVASKVGDEIDIPPELI